MTVVGQSPLECVLFVRTIVPTLPTGLMNLSDKMRIINLSTPQSGAVAIMRYADVGHVGVVENVTGNSITILEANYRHGQITRRTAIGRDLQDAANQLEILGYRRP